MTLILTKVPGGTFDLSESKDNSLRGKENGNLRRCSAGRCWKWSDVMGQEVPAGNPGPDYSL